jgi:opacity protein-like surface antigen
MHRMLFSAVLISSAAVAATAGAADADHGVYVRLDTGASFSRNAGQDVGSDVGTAAIVGGGVGYRFNPYLRGDVTLSYRNGYRIDSSKVMEGLTYSSRGGVDSVVGLANVYVDPFRYGIFRPYIGGGVGFARNQIGNVSVSVLDYNGTLDGNTSTSFAWQGSAGVGVELTRSVTVDVGYRYLDMGEGVTGSHVDFTEWTQDNWKSKGYLRAHELQLGLRYQF